MPCAMIRGTLVFLMLLTACSSIAQQQRRIDSLENLIRMGQYPDSAATLRELCWVYHTVNPGKGVQYGERSLRSSRAVNDRKGEAESLLYLGICYFNLNNYEMAIGYFIQSLKIKEELGDTRGIVAVLNNLGNVHQEMRNYEKAREFFLQALSLNEQTGNNKIGATILSNIALTYKLTGDPDHALEYNLKALQLREAIGDKRGLSASLNNIASIYADSAYHGRDIGKADVYFTRAMKLKEETGDRYGMVQGLINIGQLHSDRRDYSGALPFIRRAMDIAGAIGSPALLISCYQSMANALAGLGRYREAYGYTLRFAALRDSLYSVESSRKIAEMQVKYETEKKDQENELLKQESRIQTLQINRQRNIRNFALVLAVLILGLSVAVFSRYLLKKRTNRLLEEKNRQLAILNATREKFFSIIAHDLKNPFGTLVQVSGMLDHRYDIMPDDQKRRTIRLINQSAQMTSNLLENLLDWSLSQTGRLTCRPEPFDISALAASTMALLKLDAEKKEILLEMDVPTGTRVLADYDMIAAVLRNLLSNAIRFMDKPGTVRVSAEDNGQMVSLSVTDQGTGITPGDQEKLFRIDINHATIGNHTEKGTGLGLILCREFTEKNGGTITVESSPGIGSTFTFSLPVAPRENRLNEPTSHDS